MAGFSAARSVRLLLGVGLERLLREGLRVSGRVKPEDDEGEGSGRTFDRRCFR